MTWLFFHDEAVSFAAGHRPCALCRRSDYDRYRAAWADAAGSAPSAKEMNRVLHGERIVRGTHRRRLHEAGAADLPDGVFVELDGAPHVLTGDAAVAWTLEGYAAARARPASGVVTVITPPSTVAALRGATCLRSTRIPRGGTQRWPPTAPREENRGVFNDDRIRVTHVGSLARPPELQEYLRAYENGDALDEAAFEECLRRSVADVVRQQQEIGIDVVSDGEFGKT